MSVRELREQRWAEASIIRRAQPAFPTKDEILQIREKPAFAADLRCASPRLCVAQLEVEYGPESQKLAAKLQERGLIAYSLVK